MIGDSTSLNAEDIWILSITVHGKAVIDTILSKVAWNAAKSENWEASVIVIWFNDCANVHESGLVLVVAAHVVK